MSQDLPQIPEGGASLCQWQSYTQNLVKARGWDSASDLEIFLLFSEEVGELAKAFRQHRELFQQEGRDKSPHSLQELGAEMADVLSYLLDLAQRMDIDLEAALIAKEKHNRTRTWSY